MENTLKESIKKLIVEGKTKKAIEQLKELMPSSSKKTLTIIESEFTNIRKKELSGTLSHQEIQLAKNQINDKLLGILEEDSTTISSGDSGGIFKILIPIALIAIGVLAWWIQPSASECPDYPTTVNNRILVIPFENLGASINDANPQLALTSKINELTHKKKLSSHAEIGAAYKNFNMVKAAALSKNCNTNLLVWGTYSSKSDSIRLIMNYHFTGKPDQSKLGESISLSDITALQTGKMTKELDDAILSLCGIIALREGNQPVAKNWFEKVKNKEVLDRIILEKL